MNYEEVRLRCLEIAAKMYGNFPPELLTDVARKFADFVLGTNDSEIIGAARDFAKQVNDAQ